MSVKQYSQVLVERDSQGLVERDMSVKQYSQVLVERDSQGLVERDVLVKQHSQVPTLEHRFPAPSSKLCQIWLRTEGAFFSYFRSAVHRRGQRPPNGLGTDKTVEAT